MPRVRQTFAGAFNIMTAAAFNQAGVISARRAGRAVNLRGFISPEDISILSSVLGVTQEVRIISRPLTAAPHGFSDHQPT